MKKKITLALMKREIAAIAFFIRVFSSVGFGMTYAGLALFLIKNLHFSESFAISMMGLFLALHYSLALINGFVTGRWVSYINSLLIGTLVQMLALLLIYQASTFVFWGCALFLSGSLASSTAINMIITERFEPHEQARERIFMWNYAGQNLGNILGYSIAGYYQLMNNFSTIAYSTSALMLIALLLGFYYRRHIADIHSRYARLSGKEKQINLIKFLLLLLAITFISKLILVASNVTSDLILIFLSITVASLLGYYFLQSTLKKKALTFVVLALIYLVFWSLYFLIPTGLSLFANYNTTGYLFNVAVPPAWLPNINSFLVIIGAPFLAVVFKAFDAKKHWTAVHKFSAGLFFMAIAFLFPASGILAAHFGLVDLLWLAGAYVFITFSELLIAPVGLAAVGQYVDRDRQSLMSGLCLSIVGLGGLVASKLSNFINIANSHVYQSNHQFLILFAAVAVITFLLSAFLYCFKGKLKDNS